jgi:hypothetical protein
MRAGRVYHDRMGRTFKYKLNILPEFRRIIIDNMPNDERGSWSIHKNFEMLAHVYPNFLNDD